MADFYNLEFLGLTRNLPILPTPSGIQIAGFNSIGDTELLKRSGECLINVLKEKNIEFDIILTTELKGIAIAQELARLSGTDYVCLRKQKKCYMLNPHSIVSGSITSGKTEFFASEDEFSKLAGEKVLFADDVFSTGATFNGMINFSKNANFEIVAGAFILKEVPKTMIDSPLEFEFQDTKVLCCGILPLP